LLLLVRMLGYSQLQQRTKAGLGLFVTADLLRMVIAGYDIGAQPTGGDDRRKIRYSSATSASL